MQNDYVYSPLVFILRLQDARTIRKIVSVDNRSALAFAGLTADARVLVNKLRVEAQSYRLTMEDAPSVEYLARYLAKIQQQFTQRGGVRPFGIATLLTGVSADGTIELFQTDPAGTHSKWKAQVIGGRNSKSLREFLEKQHQDDMEESKCVRLAIQALLEVVDSGAKTMEVCIVRAGGTKETMSEEDVDVICKELEAEQEEKRTAGTTSSGEEEISIIVSLGKQIFETVSIRMNHSR